MKNLKEALNAAAKKRIQETVSQEANIWPPVCPTLLLYQPRRPDHKPGEIAKAEKPEV